MSGKNIIKMYGKHISICFQDNNMLNKIIMVKLLQIYVYDLQKFILWIINTSVFSSF